MTHFHRRQMCWSLLIAGLFAVFCLGVTPGTPASLEIIVVSSREDAQSILDQLKNGADFAALARAKSIDTTAGNGGNMGSIDPGALRLELREALAGVEPGQLSPIVHIPSGYAILKVLARNAAGDATRGYPTQLLPLSGAASVRLGTDVSGSPETNLAFAAIPKPDGWEQDLHLSCELRTLSWNTALERVQNMLAPDHVAQLSPSDFGQAHYVLAQLLMFMGDFDRALESWETAYKLAVEHFPSAVPRLEMSLGIAYLNRSAKRNGSFHTPVETVLFPFSPGSAFRDTSDSELAIRHFLAALNRDPEDYEARWLLNFAYMTLGKYPGGVPPQFLIAPERFQSNEPTAHFIDVAHAVNINSFSRAGSVIIDDFDNDGLLDVVVSSMDDCEPIRLYHNDGSGTFSDRAKQAHLGDQTGGLNIIQADYDNNGCTDILVLRGGWEDGRRKSLLRNNCDGTFTDVTRQSGLASPAYASQSAVWADIDNDGKLDLFVANEKAPAQLFLNKGDGTFVDIARSAGVDRTAYSKAVVAGDFDNDGYIDFYVTNVSDGNFLYHNNGDRTFTEVAISAGVQQPFNSFAAWFFDYDNDGLLDILANSLQLSVDEVARGYAGLPRRGETMKLYRNLGNGKFKDVTAEAGLDRVLMVMGSNFGDIDNDGFLDMYLGSGNPPYTSLLPNVLFRNKAGRSFVDVTASSGTGVLPKGHGVAFGDLDNDGDEDLFVVMGGALPGDKHAARLFENPGNGNDWITLKLTGVKSNRSALGARIHVTLEDDAHRQRSIYRQVGSGGSFGASPLQQHIGLGKSARITAVEVWWPASKARQTFANVKKNQFYEVKEFSKELTRLERKQFRLGANGTSPRSPDRPTAPR